MEQEKILKNSGITGMSIDVTYNCNFRCRHCFNKSGEHNFKQKELTDDELMQVIREIAVIFPRSLCICGGEPLLRKDIVIKMGKYYTEKTGGKTSLNMVTNGYLLTSDIAHELKEAGFSNIQISLDGAREETHEWIRNKKGSFQKAIEALKILVAEGFYVGVACVPNKKNINEIDELINLIEMIGVNEFRMQPIMKMGRAKNITEYFPSEEEYFRLSRKIANISLEKMGKMKIEWGDPIEHLTAMASNINMKYISISAYGEIEVSPYIPIVFGNIKKHKLSEYIEKGVLDINKYEFPKFLYKLAASPELLDISYAGHQIPSPHSGHNIEFDIIENNLELLDKELLEKYELKKVEK